MSNVNQSGDICHAFFACLVLINVITILLIIPAIITRYLFQELLIL